MSDLPKSHVRHWTDEASFGRGQGCFDNARILDLRLQGNTLRARCLSSRSGPSQLEDEPSSLQPVHEPGTVRVHEASRPARQAVHFTTGFTSSSFLSCSTHPNTIQREQSCYQI